MKIILSGQYDNLNLRDECLSDYKVTSVWSVINGKKSWEQQLNVLRYLAIKNGHKVSKLQICAILRDWSYNKRFEQNYPPHPIAIIDIHMWDLAETEKYILERLRMHTEATVEPCTAEERWQRPTTYAVMKEGRKSAVRVLPSKIEAEQYMTIKKLDDKHYIQERIGENIRCERYCNVKQWCEYYN